MPLVYRRAGRRHIGEDYPSGTTAVPSPGTPGPRPRVFRADGAASARPPRGGTRPQLAQDRRHVVLDGAARQDQPLGDRCVRQALGEQVQHLGLAGAQPVGVRAVGARGARGADQPPARSSARIRAAAPVPPTTRRSTRPPASSPSRSPLRASASACSYGHPELLPPLRGLHPATGYLEGVRRSQRCIVAGAGSAEPGGDRSPRPRAVGRRRLRPGLGRRTVAALCVSPDNQAISHRAAVQARAAGSPRSPRPAGRPGPSTAATRRPPVRAMASAWTTSGLDLADRCRLDALQHRLGALPGRGRPPRSSRSCACRPCR